MNKQSMVHIIPYSWKYWQELVGLKIAFAKNISRFKYGGLVRDCHMYNIIIMYAIIVWPSLRSSNVTN